MLEYDEVVDRILSIPKFTKEKHDFTVLRSYLEALGHPERGRRIIHVAGTNGKGSVCRMLCLMLQNAGSRCGGFFSPHLIRMNERIRVNGVEIPDEELVRGYEMIEAVRRGENHPMLTFFELLFVLALWYFREAGVQDIVLETGLGGRLDATTSIPADLFVITEIGLDHVEYLGDTIEKIAGEKAGIITGPGPVVFHTQDAGREADKVIEERAVEYGCREIINCRDVKLHAFERTAHGIDFSFENDYDRYDHVFLPTEAKYQVENAVTAVTAAHFLFPDREREWLRELIRRSLKSFWWEGRLEEAAPGVFVDGAHNPSAARRLMESVRGLASLRKAKEVQLIFGASGDKDVGGVLRELCVFPWNRILLTQYQGSRAASAENLRVFLEEPRENAPDAAEREKHLNGDSVVNAPPEIIVTESLEKAMELAYDIGPEGLTLITGSLYLVGEVKHILRQKDRGSGCGGNTRDRKSQEIGTGGNTRDRKSQEIGTGGSTRDRKSQEIGTGEGSGKR